MFDVGCSLFAGGLRSRLLNLINPIGLHPIDHALLPAAPPHFNRHSALGFAGRENQQRVRSGHIPTAANYFLALHGDRAFEQFDLCANSLGVGREPFQAHGDARGSGLVAVNSSGLAQIVHDQIQIAVVVKVPQRDRVVDSGIVRSPKAGRLLKT